MLICDIKISSRKKPDCQLSSPWTFQRGLNCNVVVKEIILVRLYKELLQIPKSILSTKSAMKQLPKLKE